MRVINSQNAKMIYTLKDDGTLLANGRAVGYESQGWSYRFGMGVIGYFNPERNYLFARGGTPLGAPCVGRPRKGADALVRRCGACVVSSWCQTTASRTRTR
jgi:hypothetical protein